MRNRGGGQGKRPNHRQTESSFPIKGPSGLSVNSPKQQAELPANGLCFPGRGQEEGWSGRRVRGRSVQGCGIKVLVYKTGTKSWYFT